MIKGWTKERDQVQDTRAPISPALLEKVCQQWQFLCKDQYEATLFRMASLQTFLGALRVSKMVAAGKGDSSRVALQRHDIRLVDNKVRIHICRSKANQRGKGADITLASCTIGNLCPVKAVESYLSVRGEEQGYFFVHKEGSVRTLRILQA